MNEPLFTSYVPLNPLWKVARKAEGVVGTDVTSPLALEWQCGTIKVEYLENQVSNFYRRSFVWADVMCLCVVCVWRGILTPEVLDGWRATLLCWQVHQREFTFQENEVSFIISHVLFRHFEITTFDFRNRYVLIHGAGFFCAGSSWYNTLTISYEHCLKGLSYITLELVFFFLSNGSVYHVSVVDQLILIFKRFRGFTAYIMLLSREKFHPPFNLCWLWNPWTSHGPWTSRNVEESGLRHLLHR